MIFIGYEQGMKGYHVNDLISQWVRVTHDIVFDEQAQWDWGRRNKPVILERTFSPMAEVL
jgi:hypothetical protein